MKDSRHCLKRKWLLCVLVLMLAFLLAPGQVAGQQGGSVDSQAALGSAFTYQGELRALVTLQ